TVAAGEDFLTKVAANLVDAINAGSTHFTARLQIDLLGNAKLLVTEKNDSGHDGFDIGVTANPAQGMPAAIISGTPLQSLYYANGVTWTLGSFRLLGATAGTWSFTIGDNAYSYTATSADSIATITAGLVNAIPDTYLPLVSGSSVTFRNPWPVDAQGR